MHTTPCAILDDHVTLRLYTESIRHRGARPAMRMAALQELTAFALAHDEALVHSRLLGARAPRTGPSDSLDACIRLWMTLLLSDPAQPEWLANFNETCFLMERVLATEARLLEQQRRLDPALAEAEERFIEARERALRLAHSRIARLLKPQVARRAAANDVAATQKEAA